MKHCEHCHVEISGARAACPLCRGRLQGEASPSPYPKIPYLTQKNRNLLNFMVFFSAAAVIISVLVNMLLPGEEWWSLFVAGGVASFWLSMWIIIQKRGNLHKTIVWQVVLISVIAVIWDYGTGDHGWALDFVVPLVCTGALVAMTVIAAIKRLYFQDYLIYLLINEIFGIVSLALLLGDVVEVRIPSAICAGCSLLFFAAVLAFEGKTLLRELQRRMHL